jgi:hypothetical protein
MSDCYILRDRKPVAVPRNEWIKAERFKRPDNEREWRVGDTTIGDARVSTVFLEIDHRFVDEGPPILFETLVFGGPMDGEMERYATWEEAEQGHADMVFRVTAAHNASFPDA